MGTSRHGTAVPAQAVIPITQVFLVTSVDQIFFHLFTLPSLGFILCTSRLCRRRPQGPPLVKLGLQISVQPAVPAYAHKEKILPQTIINTCKNYEREGIETQSKMMVVAIWWLLSQLRK